MTVVVQALRAKLVTRYGEFLSDQYKLAGHFLWNAADGRFVLVRSNANQRGKGDGQPSAG